MIAAGPTDVGQRGGGGGAHLRARPAPIAGAVLHAPCRLTPATVLRRRLRTRPRRPRPRAQSLHAVRTRPHRRRRAPSRPICALPPASWVRGVAATSAPRRRADQQAHAFPARRVPYSARGSSLRLLVRVRPNSSTYSTHGSSTWEKRTACRQTALGYGEPPCCRRRAVPAPPGPRRAGLCPAFGRCPKRTSATTTAGGAKASTASEVRPS